MKIVATCLLFVLIACGCGQTGDLYWPEDEQTVVDDDDVDAG